MQVGNNFSIPIAINNDLYRQPLAMAIKYYYYNRASTALSKEHAGIYARQAGHPDDKVNIHASAASKQRPENTVISSPKGWYDAGDYNKYIVNSNITVYSMLLAWEDYQHIFSNLELGIPESGNDVPDLLDEAKWNIDWMLTMQDPNDGGVYHKLTTRKFTPLGNMPHTMTQPRYVLSKSTAATLGFAAVMAQASRVYKPFDDQFPGFSDRLLKAAEKAWQWSIKQPDIRYHQPKDIKTGEYAQRDRSLNDEWLWAAAELFISTNGERYLNKIQVPASLEVSEWSDVETLAVLALARHPSETPELQKEAATAVHDLIDGWQKLEQTSAYRAGIEKKDFRWGSSGVLLNKAMTLLRMNKIMPDESYVTSAHHLVDYVLGRNPLDLSFITGLGTNQVMNIHHRVSIADAIDAPIPGGVVGGAQPAQQDKGACEGEGVAYPSNQPALSYVDHTCSFASNEVAINWNAPLIYVLAAMQ